MVGHVLDGRQLVVVRQQRRTALGRQAAHLGGPFLVADHTGVATGAVGDPGASSLPSPLRSRLSCRCFFGARGFRLTIENVPILALNRVLAAVFQVRHLHAVNPTLNVLLWGARDGSSAGRWALPGGRLSGTTRT